MCRDSTTTQEDVLSFIDEFVAQRFQSHGSRTDGSRLAAAIRARFPGLEMADIGVERLGELVSIGESGGRLIRHHDVKHLELSPGPSCKGVPAPTGDRGGDRRSSKFLRPEVWRALVFSNEAHIPVLRRPSAEVTWIPATDPAAIDEVKADPNSEIIPRVPDDLQKEWLSRFIESNEMLKVKERPDLSGAWWNAISSWLSEVDPHLERRWRRERSERIIRHAVNWANEKGIPETYLFAPSRSESPHKLSSGSASDDQLRQAICAVVRELPLAELLRLSIPVEYMRRHFTPAK